MGIAIGGMQFRIGEKKLLVFKEDPLPVLTKNVRVDMKCVCR